MTPSDSFGSDGTALASSPGKRTDFSLSVDALAEIWAASADVITPLVDDVFGRASALGHGVYRLTTVPTSGLLAVARLPLRINAALDDIAALRRSAQFIADNLADLSKSAAGIDTNAERLGVEIEAVAKIVPTLQRLTEIVDPLDGTVLRLGRLVDRLPRGGRRPTRRESGNDE